MACALTLVRLAVVAIGWDRGRQPDPAIEGATVKISCRLQATQQSFKPVDDNLSPLVQGVQQCLTVG